MRVLRQRNASPFKANRFFRLPDVAQLCGLTWLEESEIPMRELITDREEIAEQRGDL